MTKLMKVLITSNLLEKYARNECDAAEKAMVEQWLSVSDSDSEIVLYLQKPELKEQMWNEIASQTIHAKSKFPVRILYAVVSTAACALFGIISANYISPESFRSDILVNNMNGQEVKKINIGSLSFLVEPGSQCNISTDFFGEAANIEFCGAVSVSSDSATTQEFNIGTGTSSCDDTYQDKVKLRKGQTYLAMTDDEYNVITATNDEIAEGLPRVFSSRLSNRFNL
ncbi:hypothetical protein [Flavobacterium ustbae]|uniref:hypothetical protein n=1 Tax=Flavobacterium ustbae TaxID=2488790 RepID=UPI000F76EC1C|nr:hypothetical protein [Flavobacterium ustbae]